MHTSLASCEVLQKKFTPYLVITGCKIKNEYYLILACSQILPNEGKSLVDWTLETATIRHGRTSFIHFLHTQIDFCIYKIKRNIMQFSFCSFLEIIRIPIGFKMKRKQNNT